MAIGHYAKKPYSAVNCKSDCVSSSLMAPFPK